MPRFNKATYSPFLVEFILSERLSKSLLGLDVLLFSELINTDYFLCYNFVELFILLYTF